jgi:hypothetical protein
MSKQQENLDYCQDESEDFLAGQPQYLRKRGTGSTLNECCYNKEPNPGPLSDRFKVRSKGQSTMVARRGKQNVNLEGFLRAVIMYAVLNPARH